MDLNEYQRAALRTAAAVGAEARLLNAILGLAGETGEVAELLKKHQFHGHALDRQRVLDELGDVLWYIALAADALDSSLEEIGQRNVAKLLRRYPLGFSEQASRERAPDESERILTSFQ